MSRIIQTSPRLERLLPILTWLVGWLNMREELTDTVSKLLPVMGTAWGSLVAKLSQTCLLHLVEQVMGGGQHHLQGAAGHAGVGHALQGPTVHRNIPVSYSSSAWSAVCPGCWLMGQARDSLLECALIWWWSVSWRVSWQRWHMRRHQLSGLVLAYPGNYKLDKMPCQLVGLVNLGNTYYMNMIS